LQYRPAGIRLLFIGIENYKFEKMGKCAICNKAVDKGCLFMPSNVFVFLCVEHGMMRMNENSIPILEWCENKRRELCLQKYMNIKY
jgi:hypothetical protein